MARLFSDRVFDDEGLEFAFLVRDLGVALTRRNAPFLPVVGLTPAQVPVLASVSDQPGITGCEIADSIYSTPQAVSQTLVKLAEAGLVERESLGGRSIGHRLTENGAIAMWLARERFGAENRDVLAVLTEQERAAMISSLRVVLHAMVGGADRDES